MLWFEKSKSAKISKLSYILVFILLLWTCIQFSYNPVPEARYDLRIVPIVIGGLYLGIGPILTISTIIIRSFYGIDFGFYETLVLCVPLTFILWEMYPWFWKQYPKRRISVSVFMGMGLGMVTAIGMEMNDVPHNWYDSWFAYLVIPPLGIGIIAFCVEFLKSNIEMKLELIKAEKLQAVEQMGAAISHEIRNPLTAAIGFVQLLQDGYLPKNKVNEYLTIIKEELRAAERVIQDYLTFAKPSLIKAEELNVKKELKQVINILQPLANQNSVHITTEFALMGVTHGDQQKFRQIFINVIKNAIESMPTGGYLMIKMDYNRSYVSVEIRDTGVGMSKDQLERLGEPYYSTKGSKGTGLGMMVVYSIVRAMNGTINVESELGVGTTFYFKFPTYRHDQNELEEEKQ